MRHLLLISILAALTLSACAPSIPATANIPAATAVSDTEKQPGVDENGCESVAVRPTPEAGIASIFPPVSPADHTLGDKTASVTIISYSDFQCPSCRELALTLNKLQGKYGKQLRLVYRHFPLLTALDKTIPATKAAEAAFAQDKFWEMHNLLFEKQSEWTTLSVEAFTPWLVTEAAGLGLDTEKFQTDMENPEIITLIQESWQKGQEMGLPGTPVMLINGQVYGGPRDYASLEYIIGLISLGERQFTTCPSVVIDPARNYYATLKTEKGDIVIRLYADKAPTTVNNFVFLAQNGWYDEITFHRVLPGLVAYTGDPSGSGAGNPGYFIKDEITSETVFSRPGLVAMMNEGPDTGGSIFFITSAPIPSMSGAYTIFGEVLSGQDVLLQLSARDPQPGQPLPAGDRLITVTIEEK